MAREPRQSIKPCAQDVTEHAMDIYKGSLAMGKLRGQTRSSSQVFKKPYQSIKLCARQKASNRHKLRMTYENNISPDKLQRFSQRKAGESKLKNLKPHEAFNYYVEEPRQSIKVCGHQKAH